ncbi:hypothetical protein [Streptomyces sp. NPDC017941]|uniref:hypothetical protein n=1 Tax=Streptomyces sp. NPDC017941 TaxID=3365018 RepID=UPI0037B417DF
MKCIVAGHTAVTAVEFAELALGVAERAAGFDPELFTGELGESAQGRAARLAVAREVLAELGEADPIAAVYAQELMRVSDLSRRAAWPRRGAGRLSGARCFGTQGVGVAA